MPDYFTGRDAAGNTVTFAADDIGGILVPRGKLQFGVNGAAVDVSATDPLPVVQTGGLPEGSAFIGSVGISGAAEVDANILTMPGSSATTDSVTAKLDVSNLHSATTALTPKFANTGSITADTTIIAAVTSKKILIHAMDLEVIATSSGIISITDGTGGTVLLGPYVKGRVLPFNPVGWNRGTAATLLRADLVSGTATFSVTICYTEVS
jgi:hypothetical protein